MITHVQIEDSCISEILGVLNKPIGMFDFREDSQQGLPIIVITDEEPIGCRHPLQFRAQDSVATRTPHLNEVSRDHYTVRIGVIPLVINSDSRHFPRPRATR